MKIRDFRSLMKYIEKYSNNPKKMRMIWSDFSDYLELCNETNIMQLVNKIREIDELKSILYYNADKIYKKFGIQTILKMTQYMSFKERFEYIYEMYEGFRIKYYTIEEFLEDLKEVGENKYIVDNMAEVINISDIKKIIQLGILKQLKQMDEMKFNEIHADIVAKMTGKKKSNLDKDILFALTNIIDEIAFNEHKDICDLEFVDEGTFSQVFKLGNKVVKFGRNRLTNKIPYHRRILQPLLRRSVLKRNRNLYIEISEYIELSTEISDEDVYLVYKELRDDGIIWFDAKKENLGRLTKENITHFNNSLNVRNESVGFIPETIKDDEPLKKGDLIIIDTDFLFREKDFNESDLNWGMNTKFYEKFEQRYQIEKNQNKSKGIVKKIKHFIER